MKANPLKNLQGYLTAKEGIAELFELSMLIQETRLSGAT
jgi:hypothetical protein